MDEKPICRACEASVHMTREQIRAQVLRLAGSGAALSPDDIYARRLDACEACESLLYGSTCAHCGCVVPVRAMQADKACPHPAGDRWGGGEERGNNGGRWQPTFLKESWTKNF